MTDVEASFSSVMFEPQYSKVKSRAKDVSLFTAFPKFNLDLPVIPANMRDVCGEKMAVEMVKHGSIGILHRFNPTKDSVNEFKSVVRQLEEANVLLPRLKVGVSVGVKPDERKRFSALAKAGARIFCVDVAHGHHILVEKMLEYMEDTVGDSREDYCFIAGNIATKQAAEDLTNWGADVVKVGIGPGCFIGSTPITTKDGKKAISEVKVGDIVLTHRGNWKKVVSRLEREESKELIKINDIECTSNHEFYVLHRKYREIVTDDNIDEYAEWVSAKNLSSEYLLLQVK